MLIASADIIFLVSSVKGVCREIISELRNRKSNSTFSTPNSFDFSGVRNGSKANTFIFKPKALFETIEPILPQPIKPKVFPVISVPLNFDFSHFPFLVESSALGIILTKDINKAIVCSAVVTAFPKGVFITITPFLVAAFLSILSVPIPARPTIFNFLAFSKTS